MIEMDRHSFIGLRAVVAGSVQLTVTANHKMSPLHAVQSMLRIKVHISAEEEVNFIVVMEMKLRIYRLCGGTILHPEGLIDIMIILILQLFSGIQHNGAPPFGI